MAMVPVSIRSGDETDKWTNRVSGMLAALPTDLRDPVDRVRAMHDTMTEAKQQFELMPAELIVEMNQFTVPALATRAMRVATAARIADRMNPPVNLVISNVPGPRQPLYVAGARLKHFYPVSTVTDGQGLNMTVQSYLDTLDFGLVSCRELVPDLWDLLQLCLDEVALLQEASEAEVTDEEASAPTAPATPAKATPAKATPAKVTKATRATSAKKTAKRAKAAKPAGATRAKKR
jgi:WS/DGAT/MGAT family acyltransferase